MSYQSVSAGKGQRVLVKTKAKRPEIDLKMKRRGALSAKRQRVSLTKAAELANAVVTPASQVSTMIPGTYRTSNLWAMGLKGSGESKFHDTLDGGTFTNAAWKIYSLNNVPTGDGGNLRDGRQITVTNFHINGFLAGLTASYVTYRIVVLIDKQANGAYPDPAVIFINTATAAGVGGGGTTVGGPVAYRNLDNITRFEVLYDKKHIVAPSIAGMTTPPIKQFKISRKKMFNVEFSGTSGDIGTIRSNNLLFCIYCYGEIGAPADIQPNYRILSRIRWME